MSEPDPHPVSPAIASLPAAVLFGSCVYCEESLYADQPTTLLDEPLSHVGCAVHARRTGQRC